MNYSSYPFTLDIHGVVSQISFPVSLHDTARTLLISLTDGGKPYAIADGCRAVIAAVKADGTRLLNDCIIVGNKVIRYDFTKQTAAAVGKIDCEVRLYGVDGNIIASPRFTIVVYESLIDERILSEDEKTTIDSIIASEQQRVASENERIAAELEREEFTEEAIALAEAAAAALAGATKETVLLRGAEDFSLMQGGTNLVLSERAMAYGDGTIAGSKGFRIIKRGVGMFYLDGYTGGYAVGDAYSLRLDANYDLWGKITAIERNMITVDNMPSEALVGSCTIKGKWRFNDTLNHDIFPPMDASIDEYRVSFNSNGKQYSSIRIQNGNTYYMMYGDKWVYGYYGSDEGNWYNGTEDQTVDFGSSEQSISMELYYLIARSAVPIDGVLGGSIPTGDLNTFRVPGKPAVGNVDIGVCATAFGMDTKAVGAYSHAEGSETLAHGKYAHAEGNGTSAAYGAHAEGWFSHARGRGSHAEGQYTEAIGNHSHAEGQETKASGDNSHAEGKGTTASGLNAHAEGVNTTASGTYSHAEGVNSKATGDSAHAEGSTNATGDKSHAEGGAGTTASGQYSHAEGGGTKATGFCSHSEGIDTTASGEKSHAEGEGTVASGLRSHAGGFKTEAAGTNQHVHGKYNIVDNANKYATIVGNGTSATRSNAHTLDWNGNAWFAGSVTAKSINADSIAADGIDGLDAIVSQYVSENMSHVAHGSYTGTGTYGSTNKNSLSFDFAPAIIFIANKTSDTFGFISTGAAKRLWAINGYRYDSITDVATEVRLQSFTGQVSTSADGKTVYWWDSTGFSTNFNNNGSVYEYIAIG